MSTTCSKNWRCFRTDFLPVTVQQDQKHDPLCWHNLYQITQLGIQIQLLPVEVFLKQISKQVVHLLGMFQVSDKPLQEVLMPFLIRHHKATVRAQHPLSITQFCSECRKRRVQVSPLNLREPPRHLSAWRGVRSLSGGRQHSALESLLL